jgi:hypothetical protein
MFGLVALAALGLGVRFAWVLAVDPDVPEVGDASAYHLLAAGLADGEGYVRPFDRVRFGVDRYTAEYPPLHPSVIAVADLAGVESVTGQRLWLSLFGAASVVVTGVLAWRLTGRGSAAAALGAAAVAAVHPLWFQADATLMPETLAALLGGVVVATAVDAARRPSRRTWVLLGVACGAAALARSEAVLLLALVALPAAYAGARRWQAPAVVALAAAVVVGPWFVRNVVRFEELVPISTNIGSVVDGANCEATYGGELLGSWRYSDECFEGFTQPELRYLDDESLAADLHRHEGWHYAAHHVGDWPKVVLARLGRTVAVFRPAQLADLGALEGREQGADLVGYGLIWASLGLGAVGALDLRRRGLPWWVPVTAVVAIWASTALTYGNPRFLATAQPALVALGATGAVVLARRWWRR